MGYKLDGKKIDYFPSSEFEQKNLKPIYEVHKGWMESTQRAKSWSDLPALAIKFVRRIEEFWQPLFQFYQQVLEEKIQYLVKNPFND